MVQQVRCLPTKRLAVLANPGDDSFNCFLAKFASTPLRAAIEKLPRIGARGIAVPPLPNGRSELGENILTHDQNSSPGA